MAKGKQGRFGCTLHGLIFINTAKLHWMYGPWASINSRAKRRLGLQLWWAVRV